MKSLQYWNIQPKINPLLILHLSDAVPAEVLLYSADFDVRKMTQKYQL